MKLKTIDPPREFEVGFDRKLIMKDCARIELSPDEQVTFLTESANEYDLARKSWGFYATPSLNGRLKKFNLRTVLVKNRLNQFFIMLVEQGKEADFHAYVEGEPLQIIYWMDTTEKLQYLEDRLKGDIHE